MAPTVERAIIVALCSFVLMFLAPMFWAVWLALFLIDGRPVVIAEDWIDRQGRSIHLLAFRTTCLRRKYQADRSIEPWLFLCLRRAGLDKWPRLLNILRKECDFTALSGKTWSGDLRWLPPIGDMASEPLDLKGPAPPSVEALSMWDDQIDGLRVLEIQIDDSEGREGLGNDVYTRTLLASSKWMPDDLRESFLEFLQALRQSHWRGGPRGPRRPMPA